MKKNPSKTKALLGLLFFVVVVVGSIIGTFLVKQQQDNRNQASGGAIPETNNNEMNVCIVIEAEGKVLETWERVPPTKFSIKAGPVSSNFNPDKDKLPDKFDAELAETTIEAPRDTNATLENGMYAVCQVVPKRGVRYIYKRLQISSSAEFENPKYTVVKSKDISFEEYSDELFDDTVENNEKRNKNADGLVNVGEGNSRKIVIYVKLKSPLVVPTSAPTSTPSSTPTSEVKPTSTTKPSAPPTKQQSNNSTITPTDSSLPRSARTLPISDSTITPTTALSNSSTLNPTVTTALLALQTIPTNTPTRTPTRTPSPVPTSTTGGTQGQALAASSPTPTTVSSANSQTTHLPTATTHPTSALLAQNNTATPTTKQSAQDNTSTSTNTKTPTTTVSTTRNTTTITAVDLPVSGGVSQTLGLVFGGTSMIGTGFYLFRRNRTREKPDNTI